MEHAVGSCRSNLVLVPAAKRPRVPESEALEQRRISGDASCHPGSFDVVASCVESIRALAQIPRIGEVAFQLAGSGADAEVGGHSVRSVGISLPALVEINRSDRSVGHL